VDAGVDDEQVDSPAMPQVEHRSADPDSLALPGGDGGTGGPGGGGGGGGALPWLLVVVLACVAIALGVALVAALDRTPSEGKLREQRDAARHELRQANSEVDALKDQLEAANKLAAAQETISGDAEEATDHSGTTEVELGAVATDGDVNFRVLNVQRIDAYTTYSGPHHPAKGAAFFQVRTQLANDGKEAADPFCGSNGIRLVDSDDREFKPSDDSITIDGNETCSDGVRPGFRNVETLVFELPIGAKPAAVELWSKDDGDDYFGDVTRVRVNLP
jgi:hypothetical protein